MYTQYPHNPKYIYIYIYKFIYILKCNYLLIFVGFMIYKIPRVSVFGYFPLGSFYIGYAYPRYASFILCINLLFSYTA